MAKTAEARIRAGFGSTATDEYGVADSLVSNVLSLEKNFELPDITTVLHGQVELSASSSVDINLLTGIDAFDDAADFDYLNGLIVINDTSAAQASAGSMIRVSFGDSAGNDGWRALANDIGDNEIWINLPPGALIIVAAPYNDAYPTAAASKIIKLVNWGDGSGNSVVKYGFVGVKN